MEFHKVKRALVTSLLSLSLIGSTIALATVEPQVLGQHETTVQAAKGEQGVDWSRYQGTYGKWGYSTDKFAISQIGGTQDGWNTYTQWSYPTQVRNTIAMGRRAHTYIWWQNVTNNVQAEHVINTFLPQIQTPKGSIVALDVESGAQNTYAVQHACDLIRNAGFTPMVYGYKNYLVNHVDLHYLAAREQLWLAEYPNYAVTPHPNYNFFPSFENVGLFQFTSTYVYGGLDGDVDLTGVTDNGYKNGNPQKPNTNTPAIDAGKQIHKDSHNYVVKSGDSWWSIANAHHMDMYTLAKLNNQTISHVLHPGEVLRVADSGDAHKVDHNVNKPIQQPQNNGNHEVPYTYTVKSGDSWWSIANRYHMSMYTLAQHNGKTINSIIYPGQFLTIPDQVVNQNGNGSNSDSNWKDSLGDTWHHENGTLTLNTWVNLRWGARTNSAKIATLGPGSVIKYDAWSNHGGYIWLRQPRGNGQYAYLVGRQAWNHVPYGTFR